jgi:hypothetical protein
VFPVKNDSSVKSQRSDDKVIRFRCKAHKYEGMRRTHWYAATSEDAVQRSRWTFYEVFKINALIITFLIILLMPHLGIHAQEDHFKEARERMIEKDLKGRDISDTFLLTRISGMSPTTIIHSP